MQKSDGISGAITTPAILLIYFIVAVALPQVNPLQL